MLYVCIGVYALSIIGVMYIAYIENEEVLAMFGLVPIFNTIIALIFYGICLVERRKNKKKEKEKKQNLLRRGIYQVQIDNKTYVILEKDLWG